MWTRVFIVIGLVAALSGCAATTLGRPQTYQGKSGPIAWEVSDITDMFSIDGRAVRLDYTVVLRETDGVGIQFETVETSAQSTSVVSGVSEARYAKRLEPHSEIRENGSTLSITSARSDRRSALPPVHRE